MKTLFTDVFSFGKRDNSHFSYKNKTKLKTSHANEWLQHLEKKNQLIQIYMRKYEEITACEQDMQVFEDSKHFCWFLPTSLIMKALNEIFTMVFKEFLFLLGETVHSLMHC